TPAPTLMPSTFNCVKPVRKNVTVYWPPGSKVNRYTPCASVIAVRGPPIRFGLAIDTVTPGSAPPLASSARPVSAAVCCCPAAGRTIATSSAAVSPVMHHLLQVMNNPFHGIDGANPFSAGILLYVSHPEESIHHSLEAAGAYAG